MKAVKTLNLFMAFIFIFLWVPRVGLCEELIILSGRKEPLIQPVIELFESQTGIHTTIKSGNSTALGQQILQELPNPSADVYIAKESGALEYLRLKGAFEIYQSPETELIPQRFKARDGSWIGVSGRSRVIIYNTTLINYQDVPKTLDELTDQKWNDKIAAVDASNESFVSWVSALRLKLGEAKTEEFLRALKNNKIHLLGESHTDVRKAVGRGEFPLGLINHYYYHLQKNEVEPEMRSVGIVYLDQGEGGRGELVNVSGAAIIKGAKNLVNAQKFIDFLVSPEAQKIFADVNFEYPLRPNIPTHPQVLEVLECQQLSALECIKVMDVSLDELGAELEKTQELLERVEWHP